MKEQINFEEIYEAYKSSNNKVKTINEIKYFKIIEKNKVHNYQIIVLPKELFNTMGNLLRDDKGNEFKVGSPVHYSFRGTTPDWYFEIVHVLLNDINMDEIGEYVTLVE